MQQAYTVFGVLLADAAVDNASLADAAVDNASLADAAVDAAAVVSTAVVGAIERRDVHHIIQPLLLRNKVRRS